MYNGYWIRTPKFWWWIIWIWNRVDRIVSYILFYAKSSLIIPLMLVACWLWWGINVISLKAKFVEATWLGSSIVTLTVSGGAWSISRHLSPPGVAAPGTGPQLQGPHQDGQLLGGLLPPLQREHQQVARIQPRPIIYFYLYLSTKPQQASAGGRARQTGEVGVAVGRAGGQPPHLHRPPLGLVMGPQQAADHGLGCLQLQLPAAISRTVSLLVFHEWNTLTHPHYRIWLLENTDTFTECNVSIDICFQTYNLPLGGGRRIARSGTWLTE